MLSKSFSSHITFVSDVGLRQAHITLLLSHSCCQTIQQLLLSRSCCHTILQKPAQPRFAPPAGRFSSDKPLHSVPPSIHSMRCWTPFTFNQRYRCPVGAGKLAQLSERSDASGFQQAGGHLAAWCFTGMATWHYFAKGECVKMLLMLWVSEWSLGM
jgi:hypothetical protein